ncbi:MAG TPA: shikimate kinase [Bacteriovoracaceae bacterium]|nr:shikimate kinase [Bacteriovoracaceae bacterium]
MAVCRKIMIAGFSGAGKSTLLEELKRTAPSEWVDFSDLDQVIFRKYGTGKQTLADLIASVGWPTFRLWESEEIKLWSGLESTGVLALGGGSVSQDILDSYSTDKKIKICHLFAPFETCYRRLVEDQQHPRPLLVKGRSDLEKIYLERQAILAQIPWVISNVPGKKPEDLSKEFWSQV